MSVPTTAPAPAAPLPPTSGAPPPPPPSTSTAASSSKSRPVPPRVKPAAAAAAAPPARKRKPLRRRGARPDDEDESELARPGNRPSAPTPESDSDSDFLPSPQDDATDDDDLEEDDDDDDDEHEGTTEPRTPASASVEQLAGRAGTGKAKPPPPPPPRAVLAGPDVPPSWSDAVEAAEAADTSIALPTLAFDDLSLDALQALPSGPVPVSSASAILRQDKPLNKKQLALQRREAKSAALKARDPVLWEKQEKERAEREAAKRVAKKERLKEKRKERKMAEKALKEGVATAHDPPAAADTEGAAPVSAPPPAAATAPALSHPTKPIRPVVPSRPSRTGLALGLVNSSSVAPASAFAAASRKPSPPPAVTSSPAAGIPDPSSTAPAVPKAIRQSAFLSRDAQGRPVPPPAYAASARGRAPRGRGGSLSGRTDAVQSDAAVKAGTPTATTTPTEWGHDGFDELEAKRSAVPLSGSVRGGRGGVRGRGGSAAMLQPNGINPRYAHLPFHPSHRFHPGAQPAAKRGPPAPVAVAPEPVAPEATTAAANDELFQDDKPTTRGTKKDTVGVRLPNARPPPAPQQVSLAVKGAAAAARSAVEKDKLAEKENAPPADQEPQATVGHARKEGQQPQSSSVLYAADPTAFAAASPPPEDPALHGVYAYASLEQHVETSLPPFPQQVPATSSFYQIPPHLQQAAVVTPVQPPYVPRHSSPAYYAPPPPPPTHVYYPDPMALASSPSATSTPPPPFGAVHTPTSAYFLPPRPNKRVEIKAPSRDGQSPVPLRTAVTQAAPDAYEAAQQARITQLVREAEEREHHHHHHQQHHQHHHHPLHQPFYPSQHGGGSWAHYSDAGASTAAAATVGSSSPVSARAALLPGSPVHSQHQFGYPEYAPSPYYGAAPPHLSNVSGGHTAIPPASAPMYSTYTHSSHESMDGRAPAHASYPSALASNGEQAQQQSGYFATPVVLPPSQQQQQRLHHPYQQVYDPYAAAAMAAHQAQFYGAPPGAEPARWY